MLYGSTVAFTLIASVLSFTAHAEITAIKYDPIHQRLLTGKHDGSVTTYSYPDGAQIWTENSAEEQVISLATTRDGRVFSAYKGGKIVLFDENGDVELKKVIFLGMIRFSNELFENDISSVESILTPGQNKEIDSVSIAVSDEKRFLFAGNLSMSVHEAYYSSLRKDKNSLIVVSDSLFLVDKIGFAMMQRLYFRSEYVEGWAPTTYDEDRYTAAAICGNDWMLLGTKLGRLVLIRIKLVAPKQTAILREIDPELSGTGKVHSVACSELGVGLTITGENENGQIQFWNTYAGEAIHVVTKDDDGHPQQPQGGGFTGNGSYALTHSSNELRLWSVGQGDNVKLLAVGIINVPGPFNVEAGPEGHLLIHRKSTVYEFSAEDLSLNRIIGNDSINIKWNKL